MTSSKRSFGPENPWNRYPLTDVYSRPDLHKDFIVVSGPCSIESYAQVEQVCQELKKHDITYLRGGPWTFGTYPPQEPGLRNEHLQMFCSVASQHGLKSVVECLDVRLLDKIAHHSSAVQIGARHAQDYALLLEASQLPKTVFLKRATNQTVDELMGSVEYLLRGKGGRSYAKPVIVERGSVSYHNHVRWELSVSAIAHIKRYFDVPILVDASHGSGRRDLVQPLTLAGVAAGADGMLVETHPRPDKSRSDAEQAYPLSEVGDLIRQARDVKELLGGVHAMRDL